MARVLGAVAAALIGLGTLVGGAAAAPAPQTSFCNSTTIGQFVFNNCYGTANSWTGSSINSYGYGASGNIAPLSWSGSITPSLQPSSSSALASASDSAIPSGWGYTPYRYPQINSGVCYPVYYGWYGTC